MIFLYDSTLFDQVLLSFEKIYLVLERKAGLTVHFEHILC